MIDCVYIICVGNTRVVTQSALQKFQEEMGKVVRDPYQVHMYIRYPHAMDRHLLLSVVFTRYF